MFWMNMIVVSICALAACAMVRLLSGPGGTLLMSATLLSGGWMLVSALGLWQSMREKS